MAAKYIWSTLCVLAATAGLASGQQQQLIPPPSTPSGYYLQLSDDTVVDASNMVHAISGGQPTPPMPRSTTEPNVPSFRIPGRPSAEMVARTNIEVPVPTAQPLAVQHSTAPWTPVPVEPGVQVAGCNDCSDLWANACNEIGSSGISSLLGNACDSGGCDGPGGQACGGTCGDGCGLWAHYSSVYASALYLRPRNADIAYAVPIDGPIAQAPANNPIQVGRVGVVDPDYELAFSGGVNLAVNSMTSLFGEVMILDSSTSNQIATSAPNVLRSIVSHPSSSSVATDFLSGSANLDLDLETFDLGIRHLFVGGKVFAVNYHVGARYGRLEQMFDATFVANGTENVVTDIDFDGVGPRLGLDVERQSCRNRLRIYAKAAASFLAGRFQGSYFQGNSFDPTVVNTNWEAGRVVPVLDLELGGGWSSRDGRLRVSGGYLVSSWFNAVKTEDFIRSVQQNDFIELHDTITFDGLRVQAELRF